jgi:hypothetical protein
MPDQGPNAGAVNLATKGGENQAHGEVFEFLRNQVLDARSFFAARSENLKRNQFGALRSADPGPGLVSRILRGTAGDHRLYPSRI